ncbi:MAG: TetR/AcrR family transcriptional regulator [Chloroflexi bacterium]|nr:TetR/AcrR family transcriptional regulator [Chloroflexota bacterium]
MPPKPDVSTERRVQIIEAALICFTRKGYNNTTMDDIVTESGMSKGSLYWYFKSKDELFAEAILTVFMDVGEGTFAGIEQCTNAADKLRVVAKATTSFSKKIEGVFGLFLEFWASSPQREETGQLWVGMLVGFKNIVVGIIEEGISSGEFKPVDAEELVWALLAAYDGLAAYAMMIPDMDLDRISEVFAETLLSGLEANE